MSYTLPSNPSPQLQTAIAYLKGLTSYDADAFGKYMSDDPPYEHQIFPTSMGRPKASKAQFLELVKTRVWTLVKDFELVITDVIESKDRVVIHTKPSSSSVGAFTGTPYTNEYVFIFTLQKKADGSYVAVSTQEFMDSKFANTWFREEAEAAAKA